MDTEKDREATFLHIVVNQGPYSSTNVWKFTLRFSIALNEPHVGC